MNRLLRFLPAGSIVLGATTLASYAAGLLRDRIFAQSFGASRALDAYNAAFLLPDLLFNIFIASGIAAAFVPIISELLKSDRKRAEEYLSTVITAATATMALSAVVIILFAGKIAALVAPGFSPEDQRLVAELLRLLALSPLIFGASNALGSLLVYERRFFAYGLSPVLYNLGIILGTLFLSSRFGIMGAAWGTLFGALLHLAVRVVSVLRAGFTLAPSFHPTRPEFKRTLALMLPKMLGHPVELATFWAFTIVASHLESGSVAILNFARNFESVPVSLIGITIATTTYPLLARAITDRDLGLFRSTFARSFFLILGGSTVAAIAIYLIREPLIRLLLGGGAFDEESIARTALVLGAFTLAMPTESLVHLLARAFYTTKNTLIPVLLSIVGLIIAVAGAFFLAPRLGIIALPLSFFLASLTELLLLLVLLPHRLRVMERTGQSGTHLDRSPVGKRLTTRSVIIVIVSLAAALTLGGVVLRIHERNNAPPVPVIPLPEAKPYRAPEHAADEPTRAAPDKYLLQVPFTPQAPTGNWDELHNEACEETSALMVAAYFSGDKRDTLPPDEVERELMKLVAWEENRFGYSLDTTVEETAEMIRAVYGLNTTLIHDYTETDIREALLAGKVIIATVIGQQLGNPFYRQPGPPYHMFVIRGYTEAELIVNDPGTRRGMNFPYPYETIKTASADWNHETESADPTRSVIIVISK